MTETNMSYLVKCSIVIAGRQQRSVFDSLVVNSHLAHRYFTVNALH